VSESNLPLAPFTEMEAQVLELLTAGLADREIGLRMNYSERATKARVTSIYMKLGLTDTDLNKRVVAATLHAKGVC
jgi:DNA-binding NarL/FixJ family response regulator